MKCVNCGHSFKRADLVEEPDGELWCETCDSENYVTCEICGEKVHQDESVYFDDKVYCEGCADDNLSTCDDCGDYVSNDDCRSDDNTTLCEHCYENNGYFTCEDCNSIYGEGDSNYCENCGVTVCNDCWSDNHSCCNNEYEERTVSGVWRGESKGEFVSNRLVGIEFEAEDGDKSCLENIAHECGMCEDGSLDNDGIEVQTPPSSGTELTRLIANVTDELVKAGFQATPRCGTHIHIDATDFREDADKISRLIVLYQSVETLLYSMLPSSRIDNHYCKSLNSLYSINKFKTKDLEKIEREWYKESDRYELSNKKEHKYDDTRYCGFNLHSLFFRGTIEFRYHSGTLNKTKITNWVNLNLALVEYAINHSKTEVYKLAKKVAGLSARSILREIKDVIGLSENLCTYINTRINNFSKPEISEENEVDYQSNNII